jgi:hypothetical protein
MSSPRFDAIYYLIGNTILMRSYISALVAFGLLVFTSTPSFAALPPKLVGTCADSFVQAKRFRMVPSPGDPDYQRTSDDFGKEVNIGLTNGIGIYAGDGDSFMLSSNFASGHKIKVCLESLPQNCPPGDNRGKKYSFYDYRTGTRVVGYDSWHLCGGA